MSAQTREWYQDYTLNFPDNPAEVFHIGYHKTGSTFLQKNVFPSVKGSDVIFSSEDISGREFEDDLECPAIITDINPNAKILCVTRSQLTMIPSYYWLHVKSKGTLGFEEFVDACIQGGRFNYYKMYRAAQDRFPSDHVLFLPFERLQRDEHAFLKDVLMFSVGVCPDEWTYKRDALNNSPQLSSVKYIKALNSLCEGRKYLAGLRKFLAKKRGVINKLPIVSNTKVSELLTDEIKERIISAYSDSNAMLEAELQWDLNDLGYPHKKSVTKAD